MNNQEKAVNKLLMEIATEFDLDVGKTYKLNTQLNALYDLGKQEGERNKANTIKEHILEVETLGYKEIRNEDLIKMLE